MSERALSPGERPECDQAAWRVVYGGPVPAMVFWAELTAEGATPDDIAKAVRLLGLVAADGMIGHPHDFAVVSRGGEAA